MEVRIYNGDSLWFIAYADDLVVLTLSAAKLQAVLNKMAAELRKLNLQMRCDCFLGFVLIVYKCMLCACHSLGCLILVDS
jgi:hypothetical protein